MSAPLLILFLSAALPCDDPVQAGVLKAPACRSAGVEEVEAGPLRLTVPPGQLYARCPGPACVQVTDDPMAPGYLLEVEQGPLTGELSGIEGPEVLAERLSLPGRPCELIGAWIECAYGYGEHPAGAVVEDVDRYRLLAAGRLLTVRSSLRRGEGIEQARATVQYLLRSLAAASATAADLPED